MATRTTMTHFLRSLTAKNNLGGLCRAYLKIPWSASSEKRGGDYGARKHEFGVNFFEELKDRVES